MRGTVAKKLHRAEQKAFDEGRAYERTRVGGEAKRKVAETLQHSRNNITASAIQNWRTAQNRKRFGYRLRLALRLVFKKL